MYRARLKGLGHVVWMLQAKPGRSGKQQTEGTNVAKPGDCILAEQYGDTLRVAHLLDLHSTGKQLMREGTCCSSLKGYKKEVGVNDTPHFELTVDIALALCPRCLKINVEQVGATFCRWESFIIYWIGGTYYKRPYRASELLHFLICRLLFGSVKRDLELLHA